MSIQQYRSVSYVCLADKSLSHFVAWNLVASSITWRIGLPFMYIIVGLHRLLSIARCDRGCLVFTSIY